MNRKILGLATLPFLLPALAACGGDDDSGTLTIKHAVSGQPAMEALPGLYALDQLSEKYGYKIDTIEAPDAAILMEGVSTDEFQIGGGASAAAIRAILEGGKMHLIGSEANMQWVMSAKPGIETCADLAGKRVGIHSAGSAGEGYFNYWAANNCTDDERKAYKIVYVSGSDARAQALLAGQLDAAMVTYSEVPLVEDKFPTMIDFQDVLQGQSLANPIFVSDEFLEKHDDVVEQFMEEVVRIQRKMAEDPAEIERLLETYLPEMSEEERQESAATAHRVGFFPTDGGLSSMESIGKIVTFQIEQTNELPAEAADHVDEFATAEPAKAAIASVDED